MYLDKIEKFVKEKLSNEKSGHDYKHIQRVVNNAHRIMEGMQLRDSEKYIILASCLVHDIIDYKVSNNIEADKQELISILSEAGASDRDIDQILYIIENISYSKNLEDEKRMEITGQIVQDADRLDAIGAIGIARTFYYGGSRGSDLYDENSKREIHAPSLESYKEDSSVIDHFYQKLLRLKDYMNTEKAREIAEERHAFMLSFLENFFEEI